MWYTGNVDIVDIMINKAIIIYKIIPGKIVTCDINFKKITNITVAEVVRSMKNKITNLWKYMDVIKIFLTLSDFVTLCLWLLTLKDRLQRDLQFPS